MNFWDLCVALGRAIGRGCVALWHLVERMLRLTYRYWWVVITLVILSLAAALYYTRQDNLKFRVNAVALLNGPSIQQFEQAFAPLRSGETLPEEFPIGRLIKVERVAQDFKTFRVIDCKHDGESDFIDFKGAIDATDTLRVPMQDRLCVQFRIKKRNMDKLALVERSMLEYLNMNPAMNKSFAIYRHNLEEKVLFNHTQALKLDSLTTAYYFQTTAPSLQGKMSVGNGVSFYEDRSIRLFLNDIYKQREQLQKDDYKMQLATAPVVLENHFAVDPNPVNGRIKFSILFLLFGWIFGCVIAEIIDKRKAIGEWLKG